jgi:hypothetical protein
LAEGQKQFETILAEGHRDGTIRRDLDCRTLGAMIGNTVVAMLQRMASRGHILRKEQELDPDRVITMLFDALLQYLRPVQGCDGLSTRNGQDDCRDLQ